MNNAVSTTQAMLKDVNEKGEEYTWYRASGECICPTCGKEYWRHPLDPDVVDWYGSAFLHVLCNGDRVKL